MLHSKKIFGHYQRIARKQGTISYLIHLRAMEYSKSHVMNMKFCVGLCDRQIFPQLVEKQQNISLLRWKRIKRMNIQLRGEDSLGLNAIVNVESEKLR